MILRIKGILSFAIMVMILMTSCGKGNINKMDGITILGQDPETKFIGFTNEKGLVGVADSTGKIILDAEFKSLEVRGNFIVADLSDEEFNAEMEKLAKKAGLNKDSELGGDYKKVEHKFLRMGYGNNYRRLYNTKGKMLKDYSLKPTIRFVKTMKDSMIWDISGYVDPNRNVRQIVDVEGRTTDIDRYSWGDRYLFYMKNGDTYVRKPSGVTELIAGWTPHVHNNNLILTRGITDDLKLNCLNIYKPDGDRVYIEGWTPSKYMAEPDGKGLFILALEGGMFDKRSQYVRPQNIFYIAEEGEVADFPAGYYLEKDPFYPRFRLMNPRGRELFHWQP